MAGTPDRETTRIPPTSLAELPGSRVALGSFRFGSWQLSGGSGTLIAIAWRQSARAAYITEPVHGDRPCSV